MQRKLMFLFTILQLACHQISSANDPEDSDGRKEPGSHSEDGDSNEASSDGVRADTGMDEDTDADENTDTDTDSDTDTDMKSDGAADTDANADTDGDSESDFERESGTDANTDTNSETDIDSDTHISEETDTQTDSGGAICKERPPLSCDQSPADGVLSVTDEDNYRFEGDLQVTLSVVKGNTDLTIDWGDLTTDLRGRSVDPSADIRLVMISLWNKRHDALIEAIDNDSLNIADNSGALWLYTGGALAQTNLYSLGIQGQASSIMEIQPYFDNTATGYDPEQYTHMLSVQSSDIPGEEIRMVSFFTLSSETENSALTLSNDVARLTYSADIRSQNWLSVPPGTPNLTIDWEGMIRNSAGNPFVPTRISRVVVAHYESLDACGLEENFLQLEELADSWYESELDAPTLLVELSSLESRTGVPFQGIDDKGTWIVALLCETCLNPTPWFLTVLHPCS